MRNAVAVVTACLFVNATADAQSFNVDLSPAPDQPSATYAAAGLPGYWNSTPAAHNTTTFNLKDVNGVTTIVRMWQYGGTNLLVTDDPATAGDDDTLMDDTLRTFNASLEVCTFFYDLLPGQYEVTIYAWMPMQPDVLSYTNCDEEPGNPHLIVGGAWPGQHQIYVTYARHICNVTTGLLRAHSGIVPGQNPALGASMNGIQVRKLPPFAAGDMNCDGQVDLNDVPAFALALVDAEAYHLANPACNVAHANVNGDGVVNGRDVSPFVALLLAP